MAFVPLQSEEARPMVVQINVIGMAYKSCSSGL
jgi:hypothetical protein